MARGLLNALQVSIEFYNMFFDADKRLPLIDYLDNSYCDENGQIDLNTDTFQLFYHVKNKYASVVSDGTFKTLYNYIIENVIHQNDREAYMDLMNPDAIIEKLKRSDTPNFRFAHFRYKLTDGSYRWVEQAIITGEENGLKEGKVNFYIFDIQNTKMREITDVGDDRHIMNGDSDEMTGLYVESAFFNHGQEIYNNEKKQDFCVISMDIEHFKLFDEWYGRENGNYLLAKIGECFKQEAKRVDGLAGYFGQDDFVLLMPYDLKEINRLFEEIRALILSYGASVGFMPAFGVAQLSDSKSLVDAYDKATIAVVHAKSDIRKRIYTYNPEMHIQAEREYHVLLEFMQALKNNEVTFFLQPQVRLSTGKIVGAEALARWIKPNGDIVPPGDFIPALEKYGFVADLDQYIWERVCVWLRSVLDRGYNPVPISINVSQVDIFTINVPECLKDITTKYGIPPKLIKVEITESAYAETTQIVKDLVDELREMGFLVLMDDFGSGYSSLNMLSSLKVDAVKLDALFLNLKDADTEKSVHILESVVNMTKQIALPTIVEGVETESQIKFLEDLGCRYAQGFYFYRPISITQYEELLPNPDNFDYRGFVVKTNEQIRIREFLDKNIYSDTMLNNILGAVAYYSWKDERVDIVRFNQQFYESVNVPDFHDKLENIQNVMPKEDVPICYKALEEAMEHKFNGSSAVLRFYTLDGTLLKYMMRFYYLGDKEGTHRFYGSVNNITDLGDLQQEMALIAKYSSDTIVFMRRINDKWHYKVAAHGLESVLGINLQQFEDEINQHVAHERILPKDEKALRELAYKAFPERQPFSKEFIVFDKNKKKVRLSLQADPVHDQADNTEYIISLRSLGKK